MSTKKRKIAWRIFGSSVIVLAAVQLTIPYFLPMTVEQKRILQILKGIHPELSAGSAHVVWRYGHLQLLLQDVQLGEEKQAHVYRVYLQPNLFKSLLYRTFFVEKIHASGGEVKAKLNHDILEIGTLKIPLTFDAKNTQLVSQWYVDHLLLRLDHQGAHSDIDIDEIFFKDNDKIRAQLNLANHPSTTVQLVFDFAPLSKGITGKIYLKGHYHEVDHLIRLLKWPGDPLSGEADFEFWGTLNDGQWVKSLLDFKSHQLHLKDGTGDVFLNLYGRLGFFKKEDTYHWVGEDLSGTHERNHATRFELKSKDLNDFELKGMNLNVGLIHYLIQDIPEVQTLFQSLNLLPKGIVPYAQITFDKGQKTLTSLMMEGRELEIAHQGLKIAGLSGKLLYQNNILSSELLGTKGVITDHSWYAKPLNLDAYMIRTRFDVLRHHLKVEGAIQIPQGGLRGRMDLVLQNDPVVSFDIQSPEMDVKGLKELMPQKGISSGLSEWLDTSLVKGNFRDIHFHYAGKLKDFASSKNPTPFAFTAKAEELVIDYDKDWPEVSVNGQVTIRDNDLNVDAKGYIAGAEIHHVHAEIKHLYRQPLLLDIKGKLSSDLSRGWEVLHRGQLIETSHYENVMMKGPAVVDLALKIPISDDSDIKVKGDVSFQNADVALEGVPHAWNLLSGSIQFDNNLIVGKHLTHQFFNSAFISDVTLYLHGDQGLTVATKGLVDAKNLNASWLQGQLPIEAVIQWGFSSDSKADIHLTAKLDEAQSDLPSPLNKPLQEKATLTLTGEWVPNKHCQVWASVDSKVSGEFWFDHDNNEWAPKKGFLHFGPLSELHDHSDVPWFIGGHTDILNMNAWKTFFDKQPNQSLRGDVQCRLKSDQVLFDEYSLKNVIADAHLSAIDNVWTLKVNSDELDGKISLPMDAEKAWDFDLDYCKVATSKSKLPAELPRRPLTFKVKQLEGESFKLQDFDLNLTLNDQGHTIEFFKFKTPKSTFDAKGTWSNISLPHKVQLIGKIKTEGVDSFIRAFGKPTSLRDAKGSIGFDVSYEGDLYNPDFKTVTGRTDIQLERGYIKGVNPGFGQVLSLLNMDTIQRRLQLDFSDITKEGFSFDTIKGQANFANGFVRTNNLALEALTANMLFSGELELETQKVKADLYVMPNVTGSLPLAAAIAAANPAVGAAVWVMDKVLGRKIQELTKYQYQVTGSLEKPTLKEFKKISSNHYTRR